MAVLAPGDDPLGPSAVLAPGDDPPEPRAELARAAKDAIDIPLEHCAGSETLGLIMVWACMRRKCVVQLWQTKSQLGSHLDLLSVIVI